MTREIRDLPLHLIDPPSRPSRVTINDSATVELANSIRSLGLIHPVIVKPVGERYEITAGHRRYLAHHILAMATIPAEVRDDNETTTTAVKACENMIREQLTPLEEARNILEMHRQMNLSVQQISSLTGKSESWVRQRLDMINWPLNILEAVQAKTVSLAVARWLVRVDDEKYRAYLLHEAAKNGITENTAAAWVGHWQEEQLALPTEELPQTMHAARQCTQVEVRMPCFRCETPTVIHDMMIVRICRKCYQEVT